MTEADVALVFADLSGFTALTEAHGDVDAADVAARFEELARGSLTGDARLLKTIGDEVMIVAPDASAAAGTTLEIARRVDAEPAFPGVRAGIHRGATVVRGGDHYGAAVNLAARVAAHARSGQILTTEAVVTALDETRFRWVSAGTARFRNMAQPQPLFELLDPARGDAGQPVDPVCRMHLSPDAAAGTFRHRGQTYHFCSLRCIRAFVQDPDRYG